MSVQFYSELMMSTWNRSEKCRFQSKHMFSLDELPMHVRCAIGMRERERNGRSR